MIFIDYIPEKQFCKIATDIVNTDWKRLRTYYSQISDQTEVYENAIEIPWFIFVSNLNILRDAVSLLNIEVSFTSNTEKMLQKAEELKNDLLSIDKASSLNKNEIQTKLESLGFNPIRKLTEEQLRNISKLSRLKYGATFSVPGAGKTTEAISFYLIHKKDNQKLVVICPKNAFSAWEEQFDICLTSKLKIKRLTNGSIRIKNDLSTNEHDVYLISYQQFNRSYSIIADFLLCNPTFVFIDESHRMKGGENTDTGRCLQKISHLPVGKLIMSGTPMPQGVSDLLPQYLFLFPVESNANNDNIAEKIKHIYVRTTKSELLYPLDYPLEIISTPIPFNEPQKRLYDLIRSEEFRQASNVSNNSRRLYRQLNKSYIRLLQVVTNPALLLKSVPNFPDAIREAIEYGESNKIQYTILKTRKLVKEGKKVLIWSSFVDNVELLTQILSDLGARCIHGGVEAGTEEEENTRERIVKDFHDDPNKMVLIANPAACSEGISLHTICHHAIYVDRNYNAAQFLQSMDRIHRLGLQKGTTTTIEIVHTPNSIDELIDVRLTEKVHRMSLVLEDSSLNIEPVTIELDEEGFDEEDAKQLLIHMKNKL